jgi:hypothetical protein|tara:strand:+ start:80 stop:319 length:240 start_codon:yes stop_codon:yes gene_type:complete
MQASGSSFCAEGIETWHKETIGALDSTLFMPFILQYHPRLIAAGFLFWVLWKFKENESALKVPESVGEHAWFLFVDPSI